MFCDLWFNSFCKYLPSSPWEIFIGSIKSPTDIAYLMTFPKVTRNMTWHFTGLWFCKHFYKTSWKFLIKLDQFDQDKWWFGRFLLASKLGAPTSIHSFIVRRSFAKPWRYLCSEAKSFRFLITFEERHLPVPRGTSIKGKNKERYEILQSRTSFKNLRICSKNLDLLIVRLFELEMEHWWNHVSLQLGIYQSVLIGIHKQKYVVNSIG